MPSVQSANGEDSEYNRQLTILSRLVRQGRVAFFVGAGLSTEAGLPAGRQLADAINSAGNYPDAGLSLDKVARQFEKEHGRKALINLLRGELRTSAAERVTSFDLLALLQPKWIFTTNWDDLIEEALERKDVKFRKIWRSDQIGGLDDSETSVVKLHGDLEAFSDRLTITVADYLDQIKDASKPGLMSVFQNALRSTTIVFLGYGLEDNDLNLVCRSLSEVIGSNIPQHYAVLNRIAKITDETGLQLRFLEDEAINVLRTLSHSKTEFINRHREREYVTGQKTRMYTNYRGLAGSGKSYLLKHLENEFKARNEVWDIAYLDFEKFPELTDPLKFALRLDRILNVNRPVLNELDLIDRVREQKDQTVESLAAAELAKSFGRRRLLVLLDGCEQMNADIKNWIGNVLDPQVREIMRNPRENFRMVLAGRTPIEVDRAIEFKKDLNANMELWPFNASAVAEMLKLYAAFTIPQQLNGKLTQRWGTDLLFLTGGHPGALDAVLREMQTYLFMLSEDFVRTNSADLFNRLVFPLYEKHILSPNDKRVAKVLNLLETVAMMRCLSAADLFNLGRAGFLPGETRQPTTQLNALTETGLILKPTRSQHSYLVDPLLHRTMSLHLLYTDEPRFIKLHTFLYKMYQDRILPSGTSTGQIQKEQQLDDVLETFYHYLALQQVKNRDSEQVVTDKLKDLMNTILQVLGNGEDPLRWFTILRSAFNPSPEDGGDTMLVEMLNMIAPGSLNMLIGLVEKEIANLI